MRKKNQKNMCEMEAAFTLTMFLMNLLILFIIGAAVWLVHTTIAETIR